VDGRMRLDYEACKIGTKLNLWVKTHKETLKEIYRVLKDNGTCILLHEPSCSNILYKLAYKRVNAKRPHVPENVLKHKEIEAIGKKIGFKNIQINFVPSTTNRHPLPAIYYYILSKISFLQKILPCTVDIIFTK